MLGLFDQHKGRSLWNGLLQVLYYFYSFESPVTEVLENIKKKELQSMNVFVEQAKWCIPDIHYMEKNSMYWSKMVWSTSLDQVNHAADIKIKWRTIDFISGWLI